jgi:hypothetical protein
MERRPVNSQAPLTHRIKINRTSLDHLLLGEGADIDKLSTTASILPRKNSASRISKSVCLRNDTLALCCRYSRFGLAVSERTRELGIRDLFKSRSKDDDTRATRVLVAALDQKFAELVSIDGRCYCAVYPDAKQKSFENVEGLLKAIGDGYEVIHLFCDVTADGEITGGQGRELSATDLIDGCCKSGVKLLWIASDNKPEAYVKGFKPAKKPLNMILTIERKNSRFPAFLEGLLRKMSQGETLPVSWVSLAPQNSNDPRNQEAPSCIFVAGLASARFR